MCERERENACASKQAHKLVKAGASAWHDIWSMTHGSLQRQPSPEGGREGGREGGDGGREGGDGGMEVMEGWR